MTIAPKGGGRVEHLYLYLAAAFVIGAAKGGLSSAGALAVPALAVVIDPLTAAGVLLPVYIISDVVGVWLYRHQFSGRNVAVLAAAGLAGVVLAMLMVPHVSVAAATLATGVIGLAYVVQANLRRLLQAPPERRPFRLMPALFWGVLTGVTSFVSHSGTPPFQSFVLPQRLPKMVYAGTSTLVFAAINLAKWPAYLASGLLGTFDMPLFWRLAVTAVLGALAGRWLARRLPDRIYLAIIEALLLVISLRLILSAVA